ncbi:helix-turn-helix domain-containing protein [Streptomyces sp. NPDC004311]|uniref:helix-turn-helix domain-containing protein n=1 Tax=Streptomyces sp. NPDC004311 TaxID=3364698 RepID=UPI0036CD81F2
MTPAGTERPAPASAAVQWRLRMASAQRGVWTGTQLRRLLAERAGLELSAASVSALFTKQPSQVKLSTLTALCTALDCTPGELLVLGPTAPVAAPALPETGVQPAATPSAPARTRSLPPL